MTCRNHAADGVSNAADARLLACGAAAATTAGVAKAPPADAADAAGNGSGASDERSTRRIAIGGVASPESAVHSRSAVASARPRAPLSESSWAISTCTASVSAARPHEAPPEAPPEEAEDAPPPPAVAALAVVA